MKAMIFAAGLGTRLHPITLNMPKALVEVRGKALLEHAIDKLVSSGIQEIIINIHHFPDQIKSFIESKKFEVPIQISDERDKLLDTGGGLKKVASFFDSKAFLLYNVDILTDIDLPEVIKFHKESNAITTLVVRDRKTKRYLLFDKEKTLCGWKNIETGQEIIFKKETNLTPLAFSGIHIIEPKVFDLMPESDKFSMIDLYMEIGKHNPIKAYIDSQSDWVDVGKIEQLKELDS